MLRSQFKTAFILSWAIVVLAGIASVGGLLIPKLYRDTEFYKTAWQGNDFATLLVVVPMLVFVIIRSKQGTYQAQLIWVGLLLYMLYNYAFYLFGAAFNAFFLIYVALFTLSIYALFLALYHLDVRAIQQNFNTHTPVCWISGFLIFLALPLLVVEGGQCVNFIVTGKVPEAPSLIFALDLSFVLPGMVLAAILLWQRRAWGFVLTAMMLVKGITYGFVLSVNTMLVARKDLAPMDPLLPFYVVVMIGSLVFGVILFKNLKNNTI